MLAGGVISMAVREAGRRDASSLFWSVTLAGGLSTAIETVQVVIPSRDVDTTSVVLGLVGSAFGAATVLRTAPGEARAWIPYALLIWGAAVALALWSPPRFGWPKPPYIHLEHVVPFWSYFDSRTLEDLADVVGQMAFFMPLGALMAAHSWRRSFVSATLIGLSLGVLFEIGQVFLPDRVADISDALSAAAGSGLGLALWRWGESVRRSSMGVSRYRVGAREGARS